ncbi:unnamed protein product [Prorocentrum cordatum]|uniref:Alpha-2-macroglobulin domain-containing protein n=1 Tax=Prorocentrum cordatum TaxID=2364126 RepID=A0ABN9PLZ6_9DINO|nr:unnamed protein product [Polarella glacialis]
MDISSTKGEEPVLDLRFEVAFPGSLEHGDRISVESPAGFTLEAPGGNGQCNGFAWRGDINLSTKVSCNGREMTILLHEHVSEETILQFILDTANPPATPHVMQNNWIVSHLGPDTRIMATEALRSWDAVPQLVDVGIALVGQNKAAGQLSSISVSFEPMFAADELEIHTLQPTSTSFANATVTSTGHEVISKHPHIIRIRADIVVGIRTLIVIGNVRLGAPGGQTVFDLVTKLGNGDQMDEALGFDGGFFQPGLLTVKSQMIQNGHAQYVPSLWGPRMLEKSLAKFVFSSTMDIEADSTLVITSVSEISAQYQLFAQDFAVVRVNNGAFHGYTALSSGSTLTATLDTPLLAGTDYELRFTVQTPALASATASRWKVEAYSDYGLPGQHLRTTNDAMTPAFQLVDHVTLEVRSPDCPPTAVVAAQVAIDLQSTHPTELLIVAPSGFNFTEDCLQQGGWNGEIVACAQDADIMGRASARLTSSSGGISGFVSGINIRVTVPVADSVRVADPSWYISVFDAHGEQQGWGNDSVGFEVIPMQGFTVVYSGVPDMSGLMVVGFIVHTQVPAGGRIQLGFPLGFFMQCDGAFFEQLGLTGDFVCTMGTGILEVQVSDPIPIGRHAFAVTSTPPQVVNGDNSFFIRIISPDLEVLDAAMEAPGLQIQKGLPMTALDLAWSKSVPEETSTVSLGFELVSTLPSQNPTQLGELVVELPPNFELQVTSADQVEWQDQALPHAESSWMDATQPDRLSILLDEEACENLAIGAYRLAFPVKVPVLIPTYNVFVVTLCSPPPINSTSSRCTGWNHSRALVVGRLKAGACRVLHDAGYRLLRHLALELQDTSHVGCIDLLRSQGYVGQDISDAGAVIHDACICHARVFDHERSRLAIVSPLEMRIRRRAATIRIRLQRWQRMRIWFQQVLGRPVPSAPAQLIDYLIEFTEQDAPKTAPTQIAAAFSLTEIVGAVPDADRLSLHPAWLAAVRDAEFRLQPGAPPARQAPRFFISMVIGMERLVVCDGYPLFKRFIAWTRLVKVWAALRSNYTEGLSPGTLRFTASGLEGTLQRTKTTGPGRRLQHVSFFVSLNADVAEPVWLQTGFEFLKGRLCSDRDYLIPKATQDYRGFVHSMAKYMDHAASGRAVLYDILCSERDSLVPVADAAAFWSEHSERIFLVSIAAALGVKKDDRDYLGRWRAGNQSDDYVRTARQIVMEIQARVAVALRGPLCIDKSDVRDSVRKFLVQWGMITSDVDKLIEMLARRAGHPGRARLRFYSIFVLFGYLHILANRALWIGRASELPGPAAAVVLRLPGPGTLSRVSPGPRP